MYLIRRAFSMSKRHCSRSCSMQLLQSVVESHPIVSEVPNNTSGVKLIGTHHGSFHCDEALACAMLQLLPEFAGTIVRTRDQAELDKCNIVVDVGAVYDHKKLRYDHHQKSFSETLSECGFSTKLSACGLVYRHYGLELVRRITTHAAGSELPLNVIEKLYEKIYRDFIEHIDANDNGVSVSDGELKYNHSSTSLPARVSRLNPSWNQPESPEIRNDLFRSAMLLTGGEFVEYVADLATSWWPARSIVVEALQPQPRADVHTSGQAIYLKQYCPWAAHLFDVEADMGNTGDIKYVIYKDSRGSFRVQAVPVSNGSFTSRKPLPSAWRGKRNEELDTEVGASVPDGCIFVHAAGFIGGHKTKEGALAMVDLALTM